MKAITFTLAFLLFSNFIFAQYTLIPDVNFEKALISLKYDTIQDGKVRTSNIDTISNLNVNRKQIIDLTGIEDFIALTDLDCSYNYNLTTLNVSNNVLLSNLNCSGNKLSNLDLSNNVLLSNLACGNSTFTTLDVSKNVLLTNLDCWINKLSNLDLSNNILLSALACGGSTLTSLDLSNNTLLTNLYCGYSDLITLNVSKNSKLVHLDCELNNLTTLDISNNILLRDLYCRANNLTTLDISNNILLRDLNCSENNLTTLDLSNNKLLQQLECYDNNLTTLDLSMNNLLIFLYCNDNNLMKLDLRNGNNKNFDFLMTNGNPNLLCITVDNPIYSEINWHECMMSFCTDEWSIFTNEICGNNLITGNVYYDSSNNCIKDIGEKEIKKIVIKAEGLTDFYTTTDISGNYSFLVDSNQTFNLKIISIPNINSQNISCPDSGFVLNSGVGGTITTNKNFGLNYEQCAILSVEITKERMRRCFINNTKIIYKNEGAINETNAKVYVDYPEYVKIVSANKTFNLIDAEKNIYVFDIGTIAAFGIGAIYIVDSVVCGDESIRGLTQCIKAWITPKSYCAETKDTTAWDKSSIQVLEAKCINEIAHFVILNAGSGDMNTQHEYRFYYDNELAYTGSFQLNSGDSLVLEVTADGSTIRLEADQHPLHPGNSKPRTTLEACNNSENVSLCFWTQTQYDDLDFNVAEVCLEILDSYDPNDKKVVPVGITAEHYDSETGDLKYTIRFQNTGSDVAYNIIIVDTLSESLDISTFNILGTSHAYDYNVTGTNTKVLTIRFNYINLPDSTTNEAKSHGYFSFRISPIQGIAKGTKIENYADIYFDYNSAVRTDTAWVTALDTVITSSKIITVTEQSTLGISEIKLSNIKIYPNPTNEFLFVKNANSEFSKIEIFDIKGSLIFTENLISNEQKINVNSLQKGIYFIHLSNENGEMKTFKMVK